MRRIGRRNFAVTPFGTTALVHRGFAGHGNRYFSAHPLLFAKHDNRTHVTTEAPQAVPPPSTLPSIGSAQTEMLSKLKELLRAKAPIAKHREFIRRNAIAIEPVNDLYNSDVTNPSIEELPGRYLSVDNKDLLYISSRIVIDENKQLHVPYSCILRKGGALVAYILPTDVGKHVLKPGLGPVTAATEDKGIYEVHFDFKNAVSVNKVLLDSQATKLISLQQALSNYNKGIKKAHQSTNLPESFWWCRDKIWKNLRPQPATLWKPKPYQRLSPRPQYTLYRNGKWLPEEDATTVILTEESGRGKTVTALFTRQNNEERQVGLYFDDFPDAKVDEIARAIVAEIVRLMDTIKVSMPDVSDTIFNIILDEMGAKKDTVRRILLSRTSIILCIRSDLRDIAANEGTCKFLFTIAGSGVVATNKRSRPDYSIQPPFQDTKSLFRQELNNKQEDAEGEPTDGKYFLEAIQHHENLRELLANARCAVLMAQAVKPLREIEPYAHWKALVDANYKKVKEKSASAKEKQEYEEANREATLAARQLVDIICSS